MAEALAIVRELYKKNDCNLKKYVDGDGPEREAILSVANHYEFMATGIAHGVFDEDAYKTLQYSNLMKHWGMLEGFVKEARSKHGKTYFQEFEELARKWEESPLEPKRRKRFRFF